MNYAAIKSYDIANGPGVRVSLFVSGCTHHCPGCFNPETWDFDYGEKYTEEIKEKVLELLRPDYISGLTILGGEPMEPKNMLDVADLISTAKRLYPDKTIWLYSGYTFEELDSPTKLAMTNIIKENILRRLDILVDGPFIETQKDIGLLFRGSANQRIIDMPKTRAAGKIVLWEGDK